MSATTTLGIAWTESICFAGWDEHRAAGGRLCGRLGLVVTDDEREQAWTAVHDALARMPGWAVGPCTYHGEVGVWHVAVIDLRPRSRFARREAITATGMTEIAALGALVALLDARQLSGR